MSRFCPVVNRKVVYLDCLECEEKICQIQPVEVDKNAAKTASRAPVAGDLSEWKRRQIHFSDENK